MNDDQLTFNYHIFDSLNSSSSALSDEEFYDHPDSLDFRSPHFNSVKALFSDKVDLPCPDVKPLSNSSRMRFLLPFSLQPQLRSVVLSDRAFDDHQLRIVMRSKRMGAALTAKKRSLSTIKRFTHRHENEPLYMLTKAIKTRERVRIFVRRPNCFETRLTGFVEAVDSHMTMFLTNAEETVIRLNCSIAVRSIPFLMLKGDSIISVAMVGRSSSKSEDILTKVKYYYKQREFVRKKNRDEFLNLKSQEDDYILRTVSAITDLQPPQVKGKVPSDVLPYPLKDEEEKASEASSLEEFCFAPTMRSDYLKKHLLSSQSDCVTDEEDSDVEMSFAPRKGS
eukprot:GDKJ01014802.1.p1 GENE.GDKJ01014802.1~~GDKJ01014802.1.p1  ORF type:complete len:337 (+),score=37.53 GDKJ01014802.1:31-1041(+)